METTHVCCKCQLLVPDTLESEPSSTSRAAGVVRGRAPEPSVGENESSGHPVPSPVVAGEPGGGAGFHYAKLCPLLAYSPRFDHDADSRIVEDSVPALCRPGQPGRRGVRAFARRPAPGLRV